MSGLHRSWDGICVILIPSYSCGSHFNRRSDHSYNNEIHVHLYMIEAIPCLYITIKIYYEELVNLL